VFRDHLRVAIRSLMRDRGVSAVVLTCLALGIGVNVTLFAVIDGVLIQPLPFAAAHEIVVVNETSVRAGVNRAGVAYPTFLDWQRGTSSFSGMAASTQRSLALSDSGGEPERVLGAGVSANLFSLLGVPPQLGRTFSPDDDRLGAEPVIMLSDELWRRRYRSDVSVIGRSISVNGQPHTVIGVMPERFGFPMFQKAWVPLAPLAAADGRGARSLQVVGRLADGVTIERARADVRAAAARTASEFPTTHDGWSGNARPIAEDYIPSEVRLILWTMMAAVTMVLLIACANVANLMLARASARQREFSVRSAIGAGRRRIVEQLLTECVLLGLVAAPLGLALATLGVRLLDGAVPPNDIPYTVHWEINARVAVYTVVISALTGVVFGLAPALQAGRLNLVESLRDGSRGTGTSGKRARVRHALVIVEVAMALVLLVGASLFVRSFAVLKNTNPGFDTAPLMTMRFFMSGDAYKDEPSRARRVEDILRRVHEASGVEAAFASNYVPLGDGGGGGRARIDGRTVQSGEEPFIGFTAVSPQFFQTLGLTILRGRDFTESEGLSRSAVAVINQTMATRLWPDADAVGGRFQLTGAATAEWFTVIGVAPDIRQNDPDDDELVYPVAFVPYPYAATANTGLTIRTAGNPAAVTASVREAIRASDPGLPLFDVRTMQEVQDLSIWQFGLFGWMFGAFGAVALLLAGIGVYGVLAFSVSQRTQEMGVRMALGAGRPDVLRLVVRQGLTLAAIGIGIGLVLAAGVTRVVASLLFGVSPTDPVSFGGVAAFLGAVALLASYIPALRATRVDPMIALRND